MSITIRNATAGDVGLIYRFIWELADYERLRHEVRADEATLARHLFGATPRAETLIGEID